MNKLEACRMNQRDDLSQLPTREPPAPVSGNAFVYILACSDGAFYVGSAGDVAKRLAEHGGPKGAKFTHDHPGGRRIYVEGPLSLWSGFPFEPLALGGPTRSRRGASDGKHSAG